MSDLIKLKAQVLSYCERWEKNGKKVAEYICPNCKSQIINITPNKEGEVWDSVTLCYECGERHFAVKTVDGITATSLKTR